MASSVKDQFKANFSQMSHKIIMLAKMSKRVKCHQEILKFLELLENDGESDCEDSDTNSDGEIFCQMSWFLLYGNFILIYAFPCFSLI